MHKEKDIIEKIESFKSHLKEYLNVSRHQKMKITKSKIYFEVLNKSSDLLLIFILRI